MGRCVTALVQEKEHSKRLPPCRKNRIVENVYVFISVSGPDTETNGPKPEKQPQNQMEISGYQMGHRSTVNHG